jgi:hypothetical protein
MSHSECRRGVTELRGYPGEPHRGRLREHEAVPFSLETIALHPSAAPGRLVSHTEIA